MNIQLVPLKWSFRSGKPGQHHRHGYLQTTLAMVFREWVSRWRLISGLGFLTCLLMLVFAFYLQHYRGLQPCPLCIMQRLVVAVLGMVFLIAAYHNPSPSGRSFRWYGLLIVLFAGLGAGIAGYQVWLQHQPAGGAVFCLPPLEYLVANFAMAEVFELLLASPGGCSEIQWTFLGLGIPGWTLVAFVELGTVGIGSLALGRTSPYFSRRAGNVRVVPPRFGVCCKSIQQLQGRAFPEGAAPPLPLPGCMMSHCRCRYQLSVERRSGRDRRQRSCLPPGQPDRRCGRDRRESVAWS